MIDFKNASVMKLGEIDPKEILADVSPLLVESERTLHAFKTVRDYVVFTDRCLITVNVQDITGKKRDYSSLPWARVQAWFVETAGKLDRGASGVTNSDHQQCSSWRPVPTTGENGPPYS